MSIIDDIRDLLRNIPEHHGYKVVQYRIDGNLHEFKVSPSMAEEDVLGILSKLHSDGAFEVTLVDHPNKSAYVYITGRLSPLPYDLFKNAGEQ